MGPALEEEREHLHLIRPLPIHHEWRGGGKKMGRGKDAAVGVGASTHCTDARTRPAAAPYKQARSPCRSCTQAPALTRVARQALPHVGDAVLEEGPGAQRVLRAW